MGVIVQKSSSQISKMEGTNPRKKQVFEKKVAEKLALFVFFIQSNPFVQLFFTTF